MVSVSGGSKWCSIIVGGLIGIAASFSAPATLGATLGITAVAGMLGELICGGWDEEEVEEDAPNYA